MWVLASVMNGVVGNIYATYHSKEARQLQSRYDHSSELSISWKMRTFVVYMCVFLYVFLCVCVCFCVCQRVSSE